MIDHEYIKEISNLSYMLGVAKGKGCDILIEQPSRLLPIETYGLGTPKDQRFELPGYKGEPNGMD